MIAILVIALAAGSASALMFASIISGALISFLLLYLAPLPLMVAALGWGPLSANIGGIADTTGRGVRCRGSVLGTAKRPNRRHRGRHRPRLGLRPPLLHCLCRRGGGARLVA